MNGGRAAEKDLERDEPSPQSDQIDAGVPPFVRDICV